MYREGDGVGKIAIQIQKMTFPREYGGWEIYELSQVCIWGGAVAAGEHVQALG